jgi:hypothetical protein
LDAARTAALGDLILHGLVDAPAGDGRHRLPCQRMVDEPEGA